MESYITESAQLAVVKPDGGYVGSYSRDTALEIAAEGGCYAMDGDGQRVLIRNGLIVVEPMPYGTIEEDAMSDEIQAQPDERQALEHLREYAREARSRLCLPMAQYGAFAYDNVIAEIDRMLGEAEGA